jgi:hypothetical protein
VVAKAYPDVDEKRGSGGRIKSSVSEYFPMVHAGALSQARTIVRYAPLGAAGSNSSEEEEFARLRCKRTAAGGTTGVVGRRVWQGEACSPSCGASTPASRNCSNRFQGPRGSVHGGDGAVLVGVGADTVVTSNRWK